ncbi:hypothetical protein B0H19DRAFT_244263 [Mycena capillaripes]|nr:hypothetical protein B0H19DRAFT_244263 [Mycena capillaripes]
MHIISTINAKTQSSDDIPVVLITLEGKSKFLPRPETYKEMQRLVRAHYEVDSRAGLQFEVSTWDVCAGQSVELTEAAYPLLAPLLDSVSAVVVSAGRGMPTPSVTPSRRGDEEIEDELAVREHLQPEPSHGRAPESPPRRVPKVESEDEEDARRVQSRYEDDADGSISVHDDQGEDEEEDAPHARRVLNKEFPSERIQAKAAKAAPKGRGESSRAQPAPVPSKSRSAAHHSDDTAVEPSKAASGSNTDERFKVYVTGPRPEHKAEFTTRGGHLVRKVLNGVCKTFKLDPERAKLMLCVSMPDEDGERVEDCLFECANDETIARSGVKPDSRLVVRIEEELDEDEDDD